MFGLGMQELLIIGGVAVLLFGRKLPEVARSLGHSYREFRRGLSEFQSSVDINQPYSSPKKSAAAPNYYDDVDDHEEATAPMFEPPPAEPQIEKTAAENTSLEKTS